MFLSFTKHGLILLVCFGLILPAVAHVLSSPLALFLLSPLLLILIGLGFLVLNIAIAYVLDAQRLPYVNTWPTAVRPLAFSTPAAWQAAQTRSQWSHRPPQSLGSFHSESPVISSNLNDILILIVRDFVLTWYRDLSSSPSFPTAVSATLHTSLQRLINRTSALDLPAFAVKKIIPKITAHIEQFRQSEVALRGAGLERRLTHSEELDLLLASRYATKGGGRLHPAVDNLSSTFTKQTEEAHLRRLVDRALPYILPEKERQSKVLKVVVREVVACSVLYPLMDMLADPDFWNRSIDQIAGAAIRQQKLISKVRNVLEAQLPRPQTHLADPVAHTTDRITTRTDARKFESFLRSINRCSSLLDARRLKNDIMGEIRRTRALLANHEKDDWINGEKTEDVVAFLDRLYTAKRQVEKRIFLLGGEAEPVKSSTSFSESTASRLTLRDILTNPTSLSYFMEFMDRRRRSLPVQFWLTVESFKNPLESVDSGGSEDENEPVLDPSLSATLKEDITMMNERYFSGPSLDPALSVISQKHVNAIKSFGLVKDSTPTPVDERRVRRGVLRAQRQIERDMEQQDFEDFQRSELWFRIVENLEPNSKKPSPEIPKLPGLAEDTLRHPHRPRTGLPEFVLPSRPVAHLLRNDSSGSSISISSQGIIHGPPSARAQPSNLELLMSPSAPEDSSTRAPLFDDPEDAETVTQTQRMELIQAALTDIIALDQREGKHPSGSISDSLIGSGRNLSSSAMLDETRGNVSDDEEERADGDKEHGSYQLAGPGDLHLSYEIARLGNKITNLETQESMLDTLIKKADLAGDEQELRLLRKSRSSLARELRQLNFQKSQYEQQESANRLVSDRTNISIMNSTVGEEDGKSVVRYLLEIQQLAPDGTFASGWVVARRYNEFFHMHNKLRERYSPVRGLDFPGKRLVTSLTGSFVDSRRIALEKYMQNLVAIPAVCESEELRIFLSRDSPFMAAPASTAKDTLVDASGVLPKGKGIVQSMYQSVAESIDDMFFGPSMLDVIIQRLTSQAAELVGIVGTGVNDEELVLQALRASKSTSEESLLQMPGDLKPLEGETSMSSFSSPICDLILAVFELDKKNNWLRRQAIVIILQQVFGETIERKLRETAKGMLDEPHLLYYINTLKDSMWEGGQLRPSDAPRTAEERLRTRDDANRKLSALIPDLGANMIGRSNARRGARRIFAVLQNRRLNQHLMYTIVDEIFAVLFPESTQPV